MSFLAQTEEQEKVNLAAMMNPRPNVAGGVVVAEPSPEKAAKASKVVPVKAAYDIESTRKWFAITLVAAYIAPDFVLLGSVAFGRLDLSMAKELSTVFLTPLLGLAGAAVGFYFGFSKIADIVAGGRTKP